MNKFKKIFFPFLIMILFNLGFYYLNLGQNFGGGFSPHVGLLVVFGILLGPYGALGAVIGNVLCDFIRDYDVLVIIFSAFISFGVSYLGYKLWYSDYNGRIKVTQPKLDNINHVILFLSIILICGLFYSITHEKLLSMGLHRFYLLDLKIGYHYFMNFFNASLIFGIIGMWISRHFDIFEIPKKSEKKVSSEVYSILGISLVIAIILIEFTDFIVISDELILSELIIFIILLYLFLTKPVTCEIVGKDSDSILEDIMDRYLISILILAVFSMFIAFDFHLIEFTENYFSLAQQDLFLSVFTILDIVLLIFLIPSLSVLKYVEKKVIEPIDKFSKIQNFIKVNEKISSDELLEIYSQYTDENNEIGVLARSYSDLINYNNYYIDNIHKIEGEKERAKAEMNIATRIQQSRLPVEAIENDKFIINGYSKPAKEVGGDFFDYYELDEENSAIVIGDASGKGVPAALLAIVTQVMIKQFLENHEGTPSEVLEYLNNDLCRNNEDVMFVTLWLGIYNHKTGKITFSNAGHDLPLVKRNDEFKYLEMDSGIALGVVEDFKFNNYEIDDFQEVVLYTDGIIDEVNDDDEEYGEERLLNFFNKFKNNNHTIKPLLDEINDFVQNQEQFDDMTLLYLKIKND